MGDVSAIAQVDFHVHSGISHDGRGTIEQYCALALEKGMKAIGFCEHVDLDPRDVYFGQHDYEAYRAGIEEARARYGDRLWIRMGAEVGYVPRIREEITDWLQTHAYDYVAGAVHAIADGVSGISEETDALETFARYELMAAYDEYFELVRQMVVTGRFDVVAHLDLIQRFGANYLDEEGLPWGRFYGVLRKIVEGMTKREMALEINTSGLRQAPKSLYPDRYVLALYRELGGRTALIGSDAHQLDQLGYGIPAAIKAARDFELDHLVSFQDRLLERISR